MRDIGCHYVTSERDSGNGKTAEKRPLIFPAKVARAFATSRHATAGIAENHNPYIRRIS